MEQYKTPTTNFVVKPDMSLGEGREQAIRFPYCCNDMEQQPVFDGDQTNMNGSSEMMAEQKVGDHHEYA